MLSVKEINLLEAQNEGLKKQNADLQKENARLKGELDAYQMSENEANEIIAELEAAKNKYYQQTLDDEIQINELYQTLQDIKAIATECTTCGDCSNCKYNEDCDTDIEAQALGVCRMILEKITKAESEG